MANPFDSVQYDGTGPTLGEINNIYQRVLGRDADAEGLAYWDKTNASYQDVENSFRQSEEYKGFADTAFSQIKKFDPKLTREAFDQNYNSNPAAVRALYEQLKPTSFIGSKITLPNGEVATVQELRTGSNNALAHTVVTDKGTFDAYDEEFVTKGNQYEPQGKIFTPTAEHLDAIQNGNVAVLNTNQFTDLGRAPDGKTDKLVLFTAPVPSYFQVWDPKGLDEDNRDFKLDGLAAGPDGKLFYAGTNGVTGNGAKTFTLFGERGGLSPGMTARTTTIKGKGGFLGKIGRTLAPILDNPIVKIGASLIPGGALAVGAYEAGKVGGGLATGQLDFGSAIKSLAQIAATQGVASLAQGAAGAASDALGGGISGAIAGGATTGAAAGGVGALINGGNLGQGLLQGAIGGGLASGVGAGIDAIKKANQPLGSGISFGQGAADRIGAGGGGTSDTLGGGLDLSGLFANAPGQLGQGLFTPTIRNGVEGYITENGFVPKGEVNLGDPLSIVNNPALIPQTVPGIGDQFSEVSFPQEGLNPNTRGEGFSANVPVNVAGVGGLGSGLTVKSNQNGVDGYVNENGFNAFGNPTLGNPNSFINRPAPNTNLTSVPAGDPNAALKNVLNTIIGVTAINKLNNGLGAVPNRTAQPPTQQTAPTTPFVLPPTAPVGDAYFKPINEQYSYGMGGGPKFDNDYQVIDPRGVITPDYFRGFAEGGAINEGLGSIPGMAAGRLLDGPGDGMSDDINATIEGKEPVRLADGEYIIPAQVVSALGSGSSKAGSKVLDDMVKRVYTEQTGKPKQMKPMKPNKVLPA